MADRDGTFFDILGSDKASAAERLKQAKKRRVQQLKKYTQYEKHLEKESGKKWKKNPVVRKNETSAVHFAENVVLLEAAARNDTDEVRQLLMKGINPDVGNEDGLTALHQSCIDNSEEILRLLIEFGANINSCDSELWTPLHAASTCGHSNLCKFLIDHGADLLAVNGDGNMPYDICEHEAALDYIEAEMAKRGITQELIERTRLQPEKSMLADLKLRHEDGSSLEFRGRNGETPLHVAATNGYVEVGQFLLDHGVSVNVTDQDLWQPIHCATFWCQLPLVELLLHHGASLDVRNRSGESAIEICEDAETKQRILQMKKDFESSGRGFKSRVLSRRRSSSLRSASVRRSSMKEKKALSMKEAREEGLLLQNVVMHNDEEEEDSASAAAEARTSVMQAVPANTLCNQTQEFTNINGRSENTLSDKANHPTSAVRCVENISRQGKSNLKSSGQEILSSSDGSSFLKAASDSQKETVPLESENSMEFDKGSVELVEDPAKHSDTMVPLIQKLNESELNNKFKNEINAKDVSNYEEFTCGILVGRKRCCEECCAIL